MRHIKPLLLVVLAMVLSGCSLFSGDDELAETTTQDVTPVPTVNVVQAAPADDTAAAAQPTVAAAAPLPTAVTIPATAVPPEPTADRSQPSTYVVQSGDVLGLIAERFDVDIAELRRVNDLSGNLIRVGQTLTIPALDGSADAMADTDGDDETASGPVGSTTASDPAPAPDPTPVSCGANAVGHCVQSGDSLLAIASKYGVTVDSLRSANPSITGDIIRIGDLLTIPGQTTGDSTDGDTTTGDTITDPDVTPGVAAPTSDADCAARNPEYPYFHHANGRCYANPIGAGPTPTPDPSVQCPDGHFLFTDGKCYPIPGSTPTAAASPTASFISEDYGTPPCDDWEVELDNGRCWPSDTATDEQREEGRVKSDDE